MTRIPKNKAYVTLFTLGAAAAVPGLLAVSAAPISGLGINFADGTTQRHYESRFDAAFPMRDEAQALWAAFRYGALGEPSAGAVLGADGWFFTAEEFQAPEDAEDLSHALLSARAQIEAVGAELVPVFVPDKARMVPNVLPRSRSKKFRNRYDQLIELTRALGFRTVDLRPALRNEPGGPPSYMRTDTHWSPEGAMRAAIAIAEALSGELHGTTGFDVRHQGRRAFTGDLIAFADTGRWRDRVGPAPEWINEYETYSPDEVPRNTAAALFAEVTIPVALVGTSYSAREEFHFVDFLKHELRSDIVSHARVGRGPFHPMREFLAGSLTEANPRIVLWEIPERYIKTWSNE